MKLPMTIGSAFSLLLGVTLAGVSLSGCGSATEVLPGGGEAASHGCVSVTARAFRYEARASSGSSTPAWVAGIEPSLGEGWQVLLIRLTERDGEARPGTYDLSKEPASTRACSRCVYVAYQGSGDQFQVDLATSGTLVIDEVDLERGILRGSLRDVGLEHVAETAAGDFAGLAEDGHCTSISFATIDTRPIAGAACLSAKDCPNGKLQVCDPKTAQCADVACTASDPTCPGTEVCQIQDAQQGTGACYSSCTPFASGSCPSGQECVVSDYIGAVGLCKRQGPGSPTPKIEIEPGSSCDPQHIATGCGAGHVCATDAVSWESEHCYRQCDYFAESPGCDGGRCYMFLHSNSELRDDSLCGSGECHLGALCLERDDQIAFGEPCGHEYGYCRGGDVRSGLCLAASDGALACRPLCRLDGDDCPGGETCRQVSVPDEEGSPRTIPGLGYCSP